MEQENATKGPARYNAPFTPLRNPARHDKVQTILTDYIADETPEWYEELHRVAVKIEERAEKKKRMEQNRRDSDEQRQVKQKVQQTLRGTTHTKKQKTTKEPLKRK
jgi:hypothetical protein